MASEATGVKVGRITYNPGMVDPEAPLEDETFSHDGVDLTLIRWMLSLTVAERLSVLQSNIRSLENLRGAAGRR
jgi:hypothetical protein